MIYFLVILAVIMGFVSGRIFSRRKYKELNDFCNMEMFSNITYKAKMEYLKDNYKEVYEAIKDMFVMIDETRNNIKSEENK